MAVNGDLAFCNCTNRKKVLIEWFVASCGFFEKRAMMPGGKRHGICSIVSITGGGGKDRLSVHCKRTSCPGMMHRLPGNPSYAS
jgi:hypothetical protein